MLLLDLPQEPTPFQVAAQRAFALLRSTAHLLESSRQSQFHQCCWPILKGVGWEKDLINKLMWSSTEPTCQIWQKQVRGKMKAAQAALKLNKALLHWCVIFRFSVFRWKYHRILAPPEIRKSHDVNVFRSTEYASCNWKLFLFSCGTYIPKPHQSPLEFIPCNQICFRNI